MSSLDIVAYINYLRKEEGDYTELQHKHFLAKVMEVLKNTAAKFSATVFSEVNQGAKRSRPIYNFPERETMLKVMSYCGVIATNANLPGCSYQRTVGCSEKAYTALTWINAISSDFSDTFVNY